MTLTPDDSTSDMRVPSGATARLSFTSVEVALVVLAGGLGFLSDQFSLPGLTQPALVFAGMLLVVLGLEQIVTRLGAYRGVWSYAQVVEAYKALVVQLWGLILVGLGVAIDLRAVLGWLDPRAADSMWNGLLNSTATIGLVLAGIGLMTTLHGLIRLLAGRNDADQAKIAGVRDALYRLVGVATLLFGLVLALVGFLVTLAPDVINRILASLAAMLVGP